MEPLLKWAGGKRKLLTEIKKIISPEIIGKHKFYEPFVGGGSVAFNFNCPNTIINDINKELINVYVQVKLHPEELINELKKHKDNHNHDYYYSIRNMDRLPNYKQLSKIRKAARIIYLNKTCYNGLYRVNSKGYFNVPLGRYVNPDIVSEQKIKELSKFLNEKNVSIRNLEFYNAVLDAQEGDFIYFDPPYDYENSGFISYSSKGFNRKNLKKLKKVCDKLINKGCHILVSNNDTEFVNNLFNDSNYTINRIEVNRFISCDGKNRQKAKEVLIYGRK